MPSVVKAPDQTLRVPLTFGGVSTIGDLQSVDVTSAELVPGSAALGVSADLFASALTLVLTGGTGGERYTITVAATDASGAAQTEIVDVAVMGLHWAMPNGTAAWMTIAEFVARFGIEEVVRLTDTRGSGVIDTAHLVAALTDAQAMAEAALSGRYVVEGDAPILVKMAIADLARARLYQGSMPDTVAAAAKNADRTLERIRKGELPAGPGAVETAPPASDSPSFVAGTSAYPDRLAGYRSGSGL